MIPSKEAEGAAPVQNIQGLGCKAKDMIRQVSEMYWNVETGAM